LDHWAAKPLKDRVIGCAFLWWIGLAKAGDEIGNALSDERDD
jgi:hypothetical protein